MHFCRTSTSRHQQLKWRRKIAFIFVAIAIHKLGLIVNRKRRWILQRVIHDSLCIRLYNVTGWCDRKAIGLSSDVGGELPSAINISFFQILCIRPQLELIDLLNGARIQDLCFFWEVFSVVYCPCNEYLHRLSRY